jgi:sugar phosphate isomerase/epimerase
MRLGLEAGEHTLELAQHHGVRGVPISLDDLVAKGPDELAVPIRDKGLEICQIGAMGFNPLSPDSAAVAKQTATLERGIPLAAKTGCDVIAISCGSYAASAYGGSHRENYGEKALSDMAAALKPLLILSENHGVRLSIEAYIKGVVNSSESFDRLYTMCGSSALKINLDITSLYDLRDLINPDPICRAEIPKMKGKVGVVHLKGIALSEGFHIQAGLSPITDDPTDWKLVLDLARTVVDDETWVILEHVQTEAEGEKSIAFIRQIADDLNLAI